MQAAHPMTNPTNLLTFFSGCLAMASAISHQALGLIASSWLTLGLGFLGGVASLIGIAKSIYEWRLLRARDRREAEEHEAKMLLLKDNHHV